MNQETITQIKEAVAPLAQKIGEGASFTWDTLVHGQVAEGITAAIAIGGLLVVNTIAWSIAIMVYKHEEEHYPGRRENAERFGFPAILSLFSGVAMSFLLYGAIMHLYDPEYMALKELINIVK